MFFQVIFYHSLSLHIINPSASSNSDIDLVLILRKYDDENHCNISQIDFGQNLIFLEKYL